MAFITRQKLNDLYKQGASRGISPAEINAGLKQRGHTIEGFDVSQENNDQGVFSKVGGVVGGAIATKAGLDIGGLKGIGGILKGAAELGERGLRGALKTVLPKKAEKAFGLDVDETGAENLFGDTFEAKNLPEKIGKGVVEAGALLAPVPGGAKLGLVGRAIKEAADITARLSIKEGKVPENVETVAALGAAGGAFSKPVSEYLAKNLPKVANTLERISLRLTPPQRQKLGNKVEEVAQFLKNEKIVGSPSKRLEKVNDLYETTEDTISAFLKDADETIPRDKIIQEVNDVVSSKYASDRDILAIERQAEGFINTLQSKFPERIPVNELNKLKRSTYKGAYNKAGEKVIDSVEHDIGDVLRLNIEEALQGRKIAGTTFGEFNKRYGTIITARNLLKIAETRAEVGLTSKLIAIVVASSLSAPFGGGVGSAVAGAGGVALSPQIAKVLAGTAARGVVAQGLEAISKLPVAQQIQAIERLIADAITESQNQEDIR